MEKKKKKKGKKKPCTWDEEDTGITDIIINLWTQESHCRSFLTYSLQIWPQFLRKYRMYSIESKPSSCTLQSHFMSFWMPPEHHSGYYDRAENSVLTLNTSQLKMQNRQYYNSLILYIKTKIHKSHADRSEDSVLTPTRHSLGCIADSPTSLSCSLLRPNTTRASLTD